MVKNVFNRFKNSFWVMALLYVVLGIILLLYPQFITTVFCTIFGIGLAIYGVTKIISGLSQKNNATGNAFCLDIVVGLLILGVGVLLLVRPSIFVSFLPLFLGCILLLDNLARTKRAFDLKKGGYQRWWTVLILSIIGIVVGGLLIFNPFSAALTGLRVLGIGLIISGLSDCWTMISASRVSKNK